VLSPEHILNILKTECGYRDGDTIVAGVSGGADSVALLHLIHAAGIPCAAAHVNYGLRGEESDGDEQLVSELCAKLKVPLYTRKTDRDGLNRLSNNLQDAARKFRRDFFNEIRLKESVSWTALAHNSGDQVETVLMNFMRGSGLRGVAGMRYANGKWVRPLLYTTRDEIVGYLNEQRVGWREDSSNETDDYLRNRIRHHLIPSLNELDERKGKGMLKTIRNLGSSRELLAGLVLPLWKKASREGAGYTVISKSALSGVPVPHLLLNYMLDLSGATQEFTADSYAKFIGGQTGKFIENGSIRIFNDRDEIAVVYESAPGAYPIRLHPGADLKDWTCELVRGENPENFSGCEALLDSALTGKDLLVRVWNDGDKMQPFGFDGTKKVSDILTEMKVPLYLKENYPVVTFDEEIAWIPGYRIAEKFKVTDQTKTALHIKWNR